MKKYTICVILLWCISSLAWAQKKRFYKEAFKATLDSIKKSFVYQTGKIQLDSNLASINIPNGFKFLDSKQSKAVLVDLWGNPADVAEGTLGMIFPEQFSPLDSNGWAFNITYEDSGYIDDDDAEDIDYEELLKQMQEDSKASSEERIKAGYEGIEFVGWGSPPFYDKEKKVLHWAKELKFANQTENTLNYNIRVLGRQGVLMINAIGTMSQLKTIQAHLPEMTNMVSFSEGNRYIDFNPEIDKVAAYGIGGLIAGKVLAKAGLFVLLAKFWKIIIAAIVAGGGFIWKWFTGKKEREQEAQKTENKTESDTNEKTDA